MLRTIADLTPTPEAAAAFERRTGEPAPEFREYGLQEFYDQGLIHTIVRQLKSGKEATVYIAHGDNGPVAVKLYHDIATRSFRNDAVYRAGRFVGDARLERAMAGGSRKGLAARQALWVEHEFRELTTLYAEGVRVPRPFAQVGRAIAMEFIGDGDEPAPRISEAKLSAADARDAFDQSVRNLAAIVACGCIHGDYSTFNLLWWRGEVIVIDLPQLVHVDESDHAAELLRRDIDSLCGTFSRFGIAIDPRAVARTVVGLEGEALRSSPLRDVVR
jgi:RIO kinase 1